MFRIPTPMSTTAVKLAVVGAALSVTACNPVLRTHGYVSAGENKPQAVEATVDTKATVLSRLGNPSVEGTFDDELGVDTWYYINSVRERQAYLRPKVRERQITAITFDEDGTVTKVAEYGIEDGRYVDYKDRTTPTRGRELSVLEQIFGTIGRLPTNRIGGGDPNDRPGGPGGPGGP